MPRIKVTLSLVEACDRSPIVSTIMVFLSMLAFSFFEALIEELIFGKPFTHWLDPFFAGAFIVWGIYAVYLCSVLKTEDRKWRRL